MDCSKVGALIRALREEAGLTQLQLAEKLGVSDHAVSKWECGRGAPDVTLLGALSAALKVNVEGLLAGELPGGAEEGGNMKKAKWYVCPACGGLTVSSGGAEVRCCGRPLEALEVQKPTRPTRCASNRRRTRNSSPRLIPWNGSIPSRSPRWPRAAA